MPENQPSKTLAAVAVTDIEGSTSLKKHIGSDRYEAALARHDAIVKRCVDRFEDGRVANDNGDGKVLLFPRSTDAVRCVLLILEELERASWTEFGLDAPLRVRVGVHVGEVSVTPGVAGESVPKVVGRAVDMASRLQDKGRACAVTVSGAVHEQVETAVRAEDGRALEWTRRGRRRLKGIDRHVEIFEFAPNPGRAEQTLKRRGHAPIPAMLIALAFPAIVWLAMPTALPLLALLSVAWGLGVAAVTHHVAVRGVLALIGAVAVFVVSIVAYWSLWNWCTVSSGPGRFDRLFAGFGTREASIRPWVNERIAAGDLPLKMNSAEDIAMTFGGLENQQAMTNIWYTWSVGAVGASIFILLGLITLTASLGVLYAWDRFR